MYEHCPSINILSNPFQYLHKFESCDFTSEHAVKEFHEAAGDAFRPWRTDIRQVLFPCFPHVYMQQLCPTLWLNMSLCEMRPWRNMGYMKPINGRDVLRTAELCCSPSYGISGSLERHFWGPSSAFLSVLFLNKRSFSAGMHFIACSVCGWQEEKFWENILFFIVGGEKKIHHLSSCVRNRHVWTQNKYSTVQ